MKKNILFITPSLCQGGIEHSLITMLNLLDKSKYQITVFTYHEDITLLPLVPKEVEFINDTQKPHYFRKPRAIILNMLKSVSGQLKFKKYNQRISDALKEYIHNQKVMNPAKSIFKGRFFDTVVSYAVGICTEMALHIKAEKRIVFYHVSIDMHHDLLSRIFPEYNKIVAVSNGVKEMLCNNYSHVSDKVTVLENYVDSRQIQEMADEELSFDICKDKLVLCTCGRLSSEKGFDLAVESANLLKERGIDFTWYFVGDGNERDVIENLISKYDLTKKIIITGYTDNPFPYIKNCDIYIQPSYHESFGRTIKEAQILNKPIVSTDTVGGRTVLNDGKRGVLTSIDAKGLSEGIIKLSKLIEDGFKYEPYTNEDNIAEKVRFISLLESLL